VSVLGRAANPLAVADDQVAELALGIELVEEAVGVVRPGNEFELHGNAGFGGKILAQLNKSVRRVPRRPAERQLLRLRRSREGCRRRQ
jgi:hypothetical protein